MSMFLRTNLHALVNDSPDALVKRFVENSTSIQRYILHQYINSLSFQYVEDTMGVLDEWHRHLSPSVNPSASPSQSPQSPPYHRQSQPTSCVNTHEMATLSEPLSMGDSAWGESIASNPSTILQNTPNVLTKPTKHSNIPPLLASTSPTRKTLEITPSLPPMSPSPRNIAFSISGNLPIYRSMSAGEDEDHEMMRADSLRTSIPMPMPIPIPTVSTLKRDSLAPESGYHPFSSALEVTISKSDFHQIPNDLWFKIFMFLDSKKQLTKLGRVCREFHIVTTRTFAAAPQNRCAVVKTSKICDFPPVILFQYWHWLNSIVISGSIADNSVSKLEFRRFLSVLSRACPNLRHFQMRRPKDSASDTKIRVQFLHFLLAFKHLETVYIEHHVKLRDCKGYICHTNQKLKKLAVASHWEKYKLPPNSLPDSMEELHVPYLAGDEWILDQNLPNLRILICYMTKKSRK